MRISKRLYSFFVLLIFLLFLSGCKLPFTKTKQAALQVISSPAATVFLDDNHIGKTPYFSEELKPGEYTLKLVPESDVPFLTWQGIVKLSPNILTVVSRNFAETEDKVSGYILNLEPITNKDEAKISVISTPDGVVVNLDGEPKGFTPLSIDNVPEGERVLTISSPGFREEVIKAKAVKGHKLMIDVQLAKEEVEEEGEEEEEKEATESAETDEDEDKKSETNDIERPYVKIKDTPTGWLNVRSEPSTAGKDETVLIKVYPDDVYKFIEANDSGWYKIEYKEDEQGWISGKHAELYK